ncbi:MAG: hypothetical protein RSC92_03730, partial [Clostridia bacterium]
ISNKYYQKNNEYNITLYLIDDNSKSILNKYNCHVNFIVSDDKMFLIETDTSNKKYIGNFNNEITTKHLTKKFNELLINY